MAVGHDLRSLEGERGPLSRPCHKGQHRAEDIQQHPANSNRASNKTDNSPRKLSPRLYRETKNVALDEEVAVWSGFTSHLVLVMQRSPYICSVANSNKVRICEHVAGSLHMRATEGFNAP